jgi:lambda repressor-like predicted transcriptional regulator
MRSVTIDRAFLELTIEGRAWSLDELVIKAGLEKSSITRCYTTRCSPRTVIAIAGALEITPWWHLLVKEEREEFDMLEPPNESKDFLLCMLQRTSRVREKFYIQALGSGRDAFFLSIMSLNSFQVLDEYLSPDTRLNVLTWMPKTADEIRGFGKHLHEDDDKVEQTKNALIEWDKRVNQKDTVYRNNIRVRTYDSTPTLQGVIVKDKWALIEMIPYDTKPGFRPALLLRRDVDSEHSAFEFFSDRFLAMWNSAHERKIGDLPDW